MCEKAMISHGKINSIVSWRDLGTNDATISDLETLVWSFHGAINTCVEATIGYQKY